MAMLDQWRVIELDGLYLEGFAGYIRFLDEGWCGCTFDVEIGL